MCGICGELNFSGNTVDPTAVDTMLSAMVHRGPDAEGRFDAPGISAGIRRLAVIDLPGGNQPIFNENQDISVVFNGEIYNFMELREQLIAQGHQFKTNSDTEVIVHAWEEYGASMLAQLNGMFAFCLHDRTRKETFIARDRLGIKPLYFKLDGEGVKFASEIKVLLAHPGLSASVDFDALVDQFCLQYVPGDKTIYQDIRKLMPGQALLVREGRAELMQWYHPLVMETSRDPSLNVASAALKLRDLLRSSVSYRAIADVPLGVFLSGGLDSSAIATLLNEITEAPIHTFSVGFEGPEAFDEREYARIMSEFLGTRHHELVISPMDVAHLLPTMIEHLSMPVTDPALLPTYVLSKFAREHVTVVLTGEGADELFAGYRRYQYQQDYGWLKQIPALGRLAKSAVGSIFPRRVRQAIEAIDAREPAQNHLGWSTTVGLRAAAEWFEPSTVHSFAERTLQAFSPYFPGNKVELSAQLRADQGEWLPHNLLAKVDAASMAVSLEARVPFLDHRLVEWARTLPVGMLIHQGVGKRVLRSAFKDLPPSVVEGKKRGFDLPLDEWLRGPLKPQVQDYLAPSMLKEFPMLNAKAIEKRVSEHLKGKQNNGLPLFNLLSIMMFLNLSSN